MGGGGGGYGRRGQGQGESDDDRERMQQLLSPAGSMTITQKDAEVDLTDNQNRKVTFFTDGRKLQKSKDPNNPYIQANLQLLEQSYRNGKSVQ